MMDDMQRWGQHIATGSNRDNEHWGTGVRVQVCFFIILCFKLYTSNVFTVYVCFIMPQKKEQEREIRTGTRVSCPK
jgi:hypothetical protein